MKIKIDIRKIYNTILLLLLIGYNLSLFQIHGSIYEKGFFVFMDIVFLFAYFETRSLRQPPKTDEEINAEIDAGLKMVFNHLEPHHFVCMRNPKLLPKYNAELFKKRK